MDNEATARDWWQDTVQMMADGLWVAAPEQHGTPHWASATDRAPVAIARNALAAVLPLIMAEATRRIEAAHASRSLAFPGRNTWSNGSHVDVAAILAEMAGELGQHD